MIKALIAFTVYPMNKMSSVDWLKILKPIACRVKTRVNQVLRGSDADMIIGRNPSGGLTRKVDIEAERVILEELKELQIPLYYIGEELQSTIGSDPDVFVVADCVDGSLNAIRGIPFYCTSIAISNTPKIDGVFTGIVMDLCRGDVFTAVKNRGAFLNGKPIQVSDITSLSDSVLRMSLSHVGSTLGKRLVTLLSKSQHDRHLGSAALELCYFAAGFYQSFVDVRKRLRPTDLAAAYLIIKEAGGIVSFPDGNIFDCVLDSKTHLSIIASCSERLHQQILAALSA